MTGQDVFDRYIDAGAFAAADLVNDMAPGVELPVLARILAVDPPSVARLVPADVPGFVALAHRLREVFADLGRGDVDAAAARLNNLLAAHPAHPYLAKEGGRWRVHHHPVDAAVLPMWTAICAENLARLIGAGEWRRLGTCEAAACERVFLDESKNSGRRFCSSTCNNRARSAAYRRRRATA
ncbi:CGNR zinc finger domain-containing protein [Pseudonocardia sp.]|uniref:CGNR zinc finger domain-containing protein n=1 Tax=Pseudonocardia sp. TaxID=60912 RepID=UPI00260ADCC9|nr:CGNR zinc finger domain-containing protein [Pseudonocardia sp.]